VSQVDQLIERLTGLPEPFQVTYEAGCGYGRFHELLSPIAADVMAANPGQLRLIHGSKKKNDRRDAENLAKLLYLDAIPMVHVPSADVAPGVNGSSSAIASLRKPPAPRMGCGPS
jgi:transposase